MSNYAIIILTIKLGQFTVHILGVDIKLWWNNYNKHIIIVQWYQKGAKSSNYNQININTNDIVIQRNDYNSNNKHYIKIYYTIITDGVTSTIGYSYMTNVIN